MDRIKFNPYIVGNPIKSREMFFGREDDFQFVARKIGEGRSNQIVVLCGERRSGKTSILFQILGGRLGEGFLPVLIDMQMLAGIKGDREFFRDILRLGCASLDLPGLDLERLEALADGVTIERLFERFLSTVHEKAPGKTVLFLLDEYELVETKIRDGSLSESAIHYLAGILESPFRVSFVFTGSTNLEDRKVEVWKSLLGKSVYRKISYLSRNDTFRLISEPLRGSVSYVEEVMEAIYRLTGGQPFYTQVICQNMTDLLIEAEKSDPGPAELERIVREIVDNPLPQMIYSWNSLGDWDHLILAALAGCLADARQWSDGRSLLRYLRANRILLPFRGQRVNVLLEDAYHRESLEKNDAEAYRFKMDLFRRWIHREHTIWKAAKEAGVEFRKGRKVLAVAVAVTVGLAAVALLSWLVIVPRLLPGTVPSTAEAPSSHPGLRATFTADQGPFRLSIDGGQPLTTEGQEYPKTMVVESLAVGRHVISAVLPDGRKRDFAIEVSPEQRHFSVHFPAPQPKASPATAASTTPAPRESQRAPPSGAAPGETAAEPLPAPSSRAIVSEPSVPAPAAAAAEAPVPAEATQGIFILTSRPPGCEIVIDGSPTGKKTPFAGSLAAGEHDVSLSLEGFRSQSFKVSIEAGKETSHEAALQEATGWIVFDIRPTARLSLDGVYILDTPYAKSFPARAGRHTLTIVNEALKVNKSIPIEVKEGDTLTIREVLK